MRRGNGNWPGGRRPCGAPRPEAPWHPGPSPGSTPTAVPVAAHPTKLPPDTAAAPLPVPRLMALMPNWCSQLSAPPYPFPTHRPHNAMSIALPPHLPPHPARVDRPARQLQQVQSLVRLQRHTGSPCEIVGGTQRQ